MLNSGRVGLGSFHEISGQTTKILPSLQTFRRPWVFRWDEAEAPFVFPEVVDWKTGGRLFFYQPLLIREIPQNYHRCALLDRFNDPFQGHLQFFNSWHAWSFQQQKKTGGFPFSGLAESPLNLTNGSHNAANGWKMTVSFWDGFLAGVMLVSGRVIDFITRTQI